MKIVLPIFTALLKYPCEALQPVTSEREEPCGNTIDFSISHGTVARMDSSSPPLVTNLSNIGDANDIALTIFWTVGPGEHAQDVIDDQVLALRESNLLDHVTTIYVSAQDYDRQKDMAGRTHAELFAKHGDVQRKIQDIPVNEFWGRQGHAYEFATLEGLWHFCNEGDVSARAQNKNFVLYMHSKGSTKSGGAWGDDSKWRSTMQYFVLHKYADCVKHLKNGFATCGALLEKRSEGATWPHYRGNFWWARCDYINKLPNPKPPEFHLYITGNPMKPSPSGRFRAEWWLLGTNAYYKVLETSHKNCWGQPSEFTEGGNEHDKAAPEACAFVSPSSGRRS